MVDIGEELAVLISSIFLLAIGLFFLIQGILLSFPQIIPHTLNTSAMQNIYSSIPFFIIGSILFLIYLIMLRNKSIKEI